MKLARPGLIALLLALAGCGALIQPTIVEGLAKLRPGSYRIDPAHTVILFKVSHFGLSKFVGRFNDFDAELDFDPAAPESTRLDAVVRTASIDVNDPDLQAELVGSDWLKAAQYPEARFVSTRVERISDDQALFHGELTLRGVTAPLTFRATYNGAARSMVSGRYTAGFEAHAVILRSVFGIKALLPAIGDEVELEIHTEFQRN